MHPKLAIELAASHQADLIRAGHDQTFAGAAASSPGDHRSRVGFRRYFSRGHSSDQYASRRPSRAAR
jgi:hypothetical protein